MRSVREFCRGPARLKPSSHSSVRITSTKTYNAGLVVADFAAMPVGCSLWPAFWSYNLEKWPIAGEIDVIEGVNKQTTLVILPHFFRDAMVLNIGAQE